MASPTLLVDVSGNPVIPPEVQRSFMPDFLPPNTIITYGDGTEDRLDPPKVFYLD